MKIQLLQKEFLAPSYKTEGAAGMDIYLQEDTTLVIGSNNTIHLGFKAEVPQGYVAVLVPRSSIGIKGIGLRNTVGIIDSDYRGEWVANITIDEQGSNAWGDVLNFRKGDRLLQCLLLPVQHEAIEVVDSLSETTRGSGGFGSTGA